MKLEIEPGRYLMAESGVLVTEVRATKQQGANHFVMVDAGFSDLARPALYGAYHGMELIHSDGTAVNGLQFDTVVAGPLCESGDVFTQGEGGVVLHWSCRRRRWEIFWCCTTPVRMAPPCHRTTTRAR